MNNGKKKDQNFLPSDEEALLEAIHAIIVAYRKENKIPEGRFATEAGLQKNSLGVVEDKKYTGKGKRSTIDLLTLVKILTRYQNLKPRLAEYLTGNKMENHTQEEKGSDYKEKPLRGEGLYKEMYEKFLGENSQYLLIHKELLKEHRLIPVKEMEMNADNQLKIILDLTAKIGQLAERPINIHFPNVEKT